MDRELLIEIGCEEIPAGWLPSLTAQLGDHMGARLSEARLTVAAPLETFSTPRRLVVRVAKLAERQVDLEELVTGPPVSAGIDADGRPSPSAVGFARKYGVDPGRLEQVDTPKGRYLAYRKRERGRATVDVLPAVLAAVLRDLTFPKLMRWDASLDDGRGELLFGRPIRWLLFVYGGRVVPFSILRTQVARAPLVQEVRAGAVTFGHRFLTTSGRAGRAIKVRTFEEYRARLLENFVIIDRGDRHDKIARELDAKARRLGGRVATSVASSSMLLQEVPDLVEYPSAIAGTFAPEFLSLPDEVLTTTMIHHQHFFPVINDEGRIMPAFLAVVNTHADNERVIARNAERVLVARLRDARFFWDADRKTTLEARLPRLETLLFHKKLGTYREKAARIETLARWIAADVFGAPAEAEASATAARWAKADLVTDMVREFTELQGTMGGIYAREEGHDEAVWKAIYYHYLPVGVDSPSPPGRDDLARAATTWAAVSLADKLDTITGLFAAGERPTGSRDPFGLRRQAHGVLKILADLHDLGLHARPSLGELVVVAAAPFGGPGWTDAESALYEFLHERLSFVFERRGFDVRNVRAVLRRQAHPADLRPSDELSILRALPEFTESPDFRQLAVAFKRVRNIARELPDSELDRGEEASDDLGRILTEPAEVALLGEIDRRRPAIEAALQAGSSHRQALAEAAKFGPAVDRFFTDVFVMVDDMRLRTARLRLMKRLERLVLTLADVSEIVPQTES
jgi:glycyl-tRNA synthetase beta chain